MTEPSVEIPKAAIDAANKGYWSRAGFPVGPTWEQRVSDALQAAYPAIESAICQALLGPEAVEAASKRFVHREWKKDFTELDIDQQYAVKQGRESDLRAALAVVNNG